jgi:hypothetical protein
VENDQRKSRISANGTAAGLAAMVATTVLTVTFTAPNHLPETLTGLAALLTSFVALLKVLRS